MVITVTLILNININSVINILFRLGVVCIKKII